MPTSPLVPPDRDVPLAGPSADAEGDWVAHIRTGDEAAFDALFTAYYQPLCRYAASLLDNIDAAEDVVQGVFLSIWRFRGTWEVRRTLRAYLYTAVRNAAIGELRTRGTRHRAQALDLRPDGEVTAPDVSLEHDELGEVIAAAVAALPPRGRQAFRLHREDGLTYEEIAEVMGIAPSTVGIHISRALVALRKAIGPYLAPAVLAALGRWP